MLAEQTATMTKQLKSRDRTDTSGNFEQLSALQSQLAAQTITGASKQPFVKGQFVRFERSEEFVAQRKRAERLLGPSQRAGEELEYRGRASSGEVIARFDSLTFAPTSVQVRRPSGEVVRTKYSYQRVADGLFALVGTEVIYTKPGKGERTFTFDVESLSMTGGN